MSIYSLAGIKTRLKITTTDYDTELTLAAESAVAVIQNLTSIPLPQQTFTEYYNGTRTNKLVLRRRPFIRSGLQVFVDDNGGYGGDTARFDASTQLVIGQDFDIKDNDFHPTNPAHPYSWDGILYRIGDLWPVRFRRKIDSLSWRPEGNDMSVKVVYTAGLESGDFTTPTGPAAVISNAVALETAAIYRVMNGRGPTTSESLNGASFSIGQSPNIIGSQQTAGYGAAKMASPVAFALLAGAGLIDRRIS